MRTIAEVRLWGNTIGAVVLEENEEIASFEYEPSFAESGIEVCPIRMPLSASQIYRFPSLNKASFHGLPGFLADSLPDKYGNALIDKWLANQGRKPESFNAIERLCYTGDRGMGALEYLPAQGPKRTESRMIQVDQMVELASEILSQRESFNASFAEDSKAQAMQDILQIGTSAGGARAKAVIAWNSETNEIRSGQVTTDDGFAYWLLKFDGVSNNRDRELADPKGYGAIEYAYSKMAKDAGIYMENCHLLEEQGRRHFMIKRFDRKDSGEKIHMQSLAALAHYDYKMAGAYSYEQVFMIMRQMNLSMDDLEQQFLRMVFNVIARNQDDHVKNIAFLMNKAGQWSLSPAFDLTYSYNPRGAWTKNHQMSINSKTNHFTTEDIEACAKTISLKRGKHKKIIEQVKDIVSNWKSYANDVGVEAKDRDKIQNALRIDDF